MVLDGENRFTFNADAFVGAVEERHVALNNALGQRFAIDDETVAIPDRPGIGFTPNRDAIEDFRLKDTP